MSRMGHASARAALIYQHTVRESGTSRSPARWGTRSNVSSRNPPPTRSSFGSPYRSTARRQSLRARPLAPWLTPACAPCLSQSSWAPRREIRSVPSQLSRVVGERAFEKACRPPAAPSPSSRSRSGRPTSSRLRVGGASRTSERSSCSLRRLGDRRATPPSWNLPMHGHEERAVTIHEPLVGDRSRITARRCWTVANVCDEGDRGEPRSRRRLDSRPGQRRPGPQVVLGVPMEECPAGGRPSAPAARRSEHVARRAARDHALATTATWQLPPHAVRHDTYRMHPCRSRLRRNLAAVRHRGQSRVGHGAGTRGTREWSAR